MERVKGWARLGGWIGIAWPLLFVAIITVAGMIGPETHSPAEELAALASPGSRRAEMFLTMLMGAAALLGIGWCVALNELLQAGRLSRSGTLAMTFGVAGFAILAAMIVVQGSVFAGLGEQFGKLTSEAEKSAALATFRALRRIDMGLDFTWDIFISASMILFGVSMLRNPHFGRAWGISGILIAGFLFSRDVWSAPHPSNPDLSFLALIWIAAVGIQMLRRARKVSDPQQDAVERT
jgi:hypothetical protein